MARCEAEYRAARHATMVFLACDLDTAEHAGLNHHDGTYGIWWSRCTLEDHEHDPGLRVRRAPTRQATGRTTVPPQSGGER